MGEYFAQNGLGAVNYGPMRTGPGPVSKLARRISPAIGALGEASDVIDQTKSGIVTGAGAAASLTKTVISLGLLAGAGWLVGKRLAPSAASENKYAWGGVFATLFAGPLGLGIEALIADHAKK